jgi:hypothetical protein
MIAALPTRCKVSRQARPQRSEDLLPVNQHEREVRRARKLMTDEQLYGAVKAVARGEVWMT